MEIYILRQKGKGSYGVNAKQITAADVQLIEDLDGDIRMKAQTLTAANWVLNEVSGLYEYTFVNENITQNTEVEFIPHAESEDIVSAAQIKTHTPVSLGQVVIKAANAPGGDITVDVLIQNVQDV